MPEVPTATSLLVQCRGASRLWVEGGIPGQNAGIAVLPEHQEGMIRVIANLGFVSPAYSVTIRVPVWPLSRRLR